MLFRIDCLEALKAAPAASVDMVLSDWPYGGTSNAWDKRLDLAAIWPELWRVVKPGGPVALFARPPFDKVLACNDMARYRYEFVWAKPNGTNFFDVKRMPFKRTERILVFCERLPKWHPVMTPGKPYKTTRPKATLVTNQRSTPRTLSTHNPSGLRWPTDVLEFAPDRGLHPTQKPVALCEWLIKAFTEPGDVILDNCAGSGTTCVAALRTGRRFVAFETDPGYCATAQERIRAELEELHGRIWGD